MYSETVSVFCFILIDNTSLAFGADTHLFMSLKVVRGSKREMTRKDVVAMVTNTTHGNPAKPALSSTTHRPKSHWLPRLPSPPDPHNKVAWQPKLLQTRFQHKRPQSTFRVSIFNKKKAILRAISQKLEQENAKKAIVEALFCSTDSVNQKKYFLPGR